MAAYKKMRVSELQDECQTRGIDHEGLNKKGLIRALLEHRTRSARDEEDEDGQRDVEMVEDGEVSFRRAEDRPENSESVNGTSSAPGVRQGQSPDAESLSLLELKVALAREEQEKIREEKERAESAWQIEKQRLELGLGQNANPANPNVRSDIARLLPRQTEAEPLIFFSAFERTLILNEIPKQQWPKLLGACLTPKAHKALSALSLEEHQDYDVCKKHILDYYRLDSNEYLKRFRTARREAGETHKMLRARLSDYLSYYVDSRSISTYKALYDDMVTQQLLCTLAPDVKAFVLSKEPRSAEEASNYADLNVQMSRSTVGMGAGASAQNQAPGMGQSHQFNKGSAAPAQTQSQQTPGGRGNGQDPASIKRQGCFVCGSLTHKKAFCPQAKQGINNARPNFTVCTMCGVFHAINTPCHGRGPPGIYAAAQCASECRAARNENVVRSQFTLPIRINNYEVEAIRDTGCLTHTILCPRFVNDEDYTGNFMTCRGVFEGVCHNVPLARIRMYAPELGCPHEISVLVGVWDLGPDVQCLLGNQTFQRHSQFTDIVKRRARPNKAINLRANLGPAQPVALNQRGGALTADS